MKFLRNARHRQSKKNNHHKHNQRAALKPARRSRKKPMNNRIKLKTPAIKNRSEMETLVGEIAGLKLNEQLLNAGMDAEIQGVRDNYKARFGTIAEVLADK